MQFDSLAFAVFFGLVLLLARGVAAWRPRKALLLAASYTFYAAWNPVFLPLLLASTSFDGWAARRMAAAHGERARRGWLLAVLGANLGLLSAFKYTQFLLDTMAGVAALAGVVMQAPRLDIVLPIGISFYTFHSLSYCLDVYRGRVQPTRSWLDYSLYVAFFPQLVAGPITRWTQMREQLEEPRTMDARKLGLGLAMIVFGLFEKVVLADAVFAPVADATFRSAGTGGALAAWTGTAAFSGQIFCDFAGYSTCALGAALALGFRLPVNFRNPYAAIGLSDFWRRWHVSLSSWLRDYLYVPLGGSRHGAVRTAAALAATMLLGGLWHGAAWTFVVWGALHGLLLVAEHGLRALVSRSGLVPGRVARAVAALSTLVAVMRAWVWFRAPGFDVAWALSRTLLGLGDAAAGAAPLNAAQRLAWAAFAVLLAAQWIGRDLELEALLECIPAPLLGAGLGLLLAAIVLTPGDSHVFIYFQF